MKPSTASAALVLALMLAACGRAGSGSPRADSSTACALIAQPEALFGADLEKTSARDVGDASCHWQSADGRRGGDLILFSGRHLGGVAPQAFVAQTARQWGAAQADFPVEALSGVGDEAQMANHMPGYQTQIVFRKGDRVVTLLAWSGDPTMNGEQLARRMATSAAGALN